MNTPINITFTIADLLLGGFFALGVIALVYLILVLKETYKVLKAALGFYEKNSQSINVVIEDSSKIIHKASVISEIIPEEPLTIFEDFKGSFSVANSILSMLLSFFGKNKKA